jgi:hypothetical protein
MAIDSIRLMDNLLYMLANVWDNHNFLIICWGVGWRSIGRSMKDTCRKLVNCSYLCRCLIVI